jgi:hypothetical protein
MPRRIEQPHNPALLIESPRSGVLLFAAAMIHDATYGYDCAIGTCHCGGQGKAGMLETAAVFSPTVRCRRYPVHSRRSLRT